MIKLDYNKINISELNKITGKLIYDRTQSDVDYALSCRRGCIYSEQDLKGAYNISDRNRVGAAVNFLAACLWETGTRELLINIREDWNLYDIIKRADNGKVLSSLALLKIFLPYDRTGEIPENLDGMTYIKANNLEKALLDLYGVFERILDSWLYCGEAHASEENNY